MARPRKVVETETAVAPAETKRVRCIIPNVWTSRGKLLRGEEMEIPAAEAYLMDGLDQIKIVRASDAE